MNGHREQDTRGTGRAKGEQADKLQRKMGGSVHRPVNQHAKRKGRQRDVPEGGMGVMYIFY